MGQTGHYVRTLPAVQEVAIRDSRPTPVYSTMSLRPGSPWTSTSRPVHLECHRLVDVPPQAPLKPASNASSPNASSPNGLGDDGVQPPMLCTKPSALSTRSTPVPPWSSVAKKRARLLAVARQARHGGAARCGRLACGRPQAPEVITQLAKSRRNLWLLDPGTGHGAAGAVHQKVP